MAGAVQIKSFAGGMNKDLDYSILPENTYIHAENFKLIANQDSNSFVLENAEGNKQVIQLATYYRAVGYCFIDPYLVVFTVHKDNGTSRIYRYVVNNDLIQDTDIIYTDSVALGRLNFSTTHPIKAVGVYESDDVVKVYWTDGYNEDRFMNILDDNLSTYTIDKFSMVSDFPDLSGLDVDTRAEFVELVEGNLPVSRIQYTYQYYTTYGSSTRFAPVSPGIIIPKGNIPYLYRGGEDEEYTGKGTKIKIRVPSVKEYNRIRLVALDYKSANTVPVVRVFAEYELDTSDTTTTYYFTDIGNTINEMVYEDFLTYGSATYKSKDITTKDNILFKANIEESVFDVDFDARVYRFTSGGWAVLYESDGSSYTVGSTGTWTHTGGSSGTEWLLPETADLINRYNAPEYESSVLTKLQSNGVTYGAEGKNMSIAFSTTTLDIDTAGIGGSGNNRTVNPASGDDPADPYNVAYRSSFQRHEVYRLGIVFFNKKMQPSPVKWMCDLKMPRHYESDVGMLYRFSYVNGTTTGAVSIPLGITVTMKNAPTDDFHAWQVVYVKRESQDRSVLASGLMQTPIGSDAGASTPDHSFYFPDGSPYSPSDYPRLTRESETSDEDYGYRAMMLISPEINFNKNLTYIDGDYLQYNGYFHYDGTENSVAVTAKNWGAHKLTQFDGEGNDQSTLSTFKIISQLTEEEADITQMVQVGSMLYVNYTTGDTGEEFRGPHGTIGLAISTSEPLQPSTLTNRISYVSYMRNRFETQYGGIDYYSRQRNEYVGISELKYGTGSVTTYEGDTHIGFYWYAKQAIDISNYSFFSEGDLGSWFVSLMFPVETSIVLALRHDEIPQNSKGFALTREIAGVYEAEQDTYPQDDLYLTQEKDLYLYNALYSEQDSGHVYLDTLFDESEQTYFPTRVRHSDVKTNGELQDAYTVFRSNNFKDVDGAHGPVNNIETFKNQLFFWQNTAFGVLAVNQRALIQDNNPGVLALGTGATLDRYDYISTRTGNLNTNGIVISNTGLYWVDNRKNEVARFREGEQSISKAKGMQSWFNGNGKVGHVIGVYDSKYNDVIFTVVFSNKLTATNITGEYADQFSIDEISAYNSTTEPINVMIDGVFDAKHARQNIATWVTDHWELDENPYGKDGSEYYTTFIGNDDKTYTLSYNEQVDAFVSFHSFKPTLYMECNNTYLSEKHTTLVYRLYIHNHPDANRSEYYGIEYDSVITTVFNKDYPHTKVFDVVKWVSESEDGSGINQFKDTFKYVEIYNDYQHTGDRELYYQHNDPIPVYTRTTPISRRERTWSLQIPRNIVDRTGVDIDTNLDITDSTNWDSTREFKERIRDKYMVAKFTYDNVNGNVFSVPFVSTTFRKSFR